MTEFEWEWFDYLSRLEVEVILGTVDRQRLLDERTRFGQIAGREIELSGLLPVVTRIMHITMLAQREADFRVRYMSHDAAFRPALVVPN